MSKNSNLTNVMATRDHSKNGASPKSHTSKRKSFFMLTMLSLLLFVGCKDEYFNTESVSHSYSDILTYEVSGRDTTLSVMAMIKGSGSLKMDTTNLWCTLNKKLVLNETKDSVEIVLDIARNETGKTRIA